MDQPPWKFKVLQYISAYGTLREARVVQLLESYEYICPTCGQPGRELLASPYGLLCHACYQRWQEFLEDSFRAHVAEYKRTHPADRGFA